MSRAKPLSEKNHQVTAPFLKWAGGKQWLASKLAKLLPAIEGRYFEPFLGGGSLFFTVRPTYSVLGDINSELIGSYVALRDHPIELMGYFEKWPNERATYYRLRRTTFSDPVRAAARFIYLNKTCWNGLYRVNKSGGFNVPYANNGRKTLTLSQGLAASEALTGTELRSVDFEELLADAQKGDFVYLDPPYVSSGNTNGFNRYNETLFSWQDQVRLAQVAASLSGSGCIVVVSNAGTREIAELYRSFHIHRVDRNSNLTTKDQRRPSVRELLITNSRPLSQRLDTLRE